MRIKQLFKTISAFAIAAILFTPFTSCGDDDNNGGEDPVKKQTPKSAKAQYKIECSQTMLDLLDITITYIDKGQKMTEQISKLSTTITAEGPSLPATFGFKIHTAVKANADFSKGGPYNFKYGTNTTGFEVFDAEGKAITGLAVQSSITYAENSWSSEDKVRKGYDNKDIISVGFEVGTDGKATDKTIPWV